MDPKRTISISEARKRIFEIADEVQKPDIYYTLTENGKPKAVILSAEEFDSLLEDLEIYSDPQILKDIEEAEKEIKEGKFYTWDEIKAELGLGTPSLVLNDRGKTKYSVSRKNRKK